MLRTLALTALAGAGAISIAGCGAKGETPDFSHSSQNLTGPLPSFADCPVLAENVTAVSGDGHVMITKACFKDDAGKYYDALLSDSEVPAPGLAVLPAGRKYSFVVQFGDGWVPSAGAIASGNAARAYAGPDNIYGQCDVTPEDDPKNLVASNATLDGNVMTVALPDAVPSGDQVSFELDFGVLYPTHYSCAADAAVGFCEGFVTRLYADHAPPIVTTCSK